MDVIRRNTDYALRLICGLVKDQQNPVSARELAKNTAVSYELACKLLQKLAKAKLIKSIMGPTGGFQMAKAPEKVSLFEVIEAVQGDICLNRCVPDVSKCPNGACCPLSRKLFGLQSYIDDYLKKTMLTDL